MFSVWQIINNKKISTIVINYDQQQWILAFCWKKIIDFMEFRSIQSNSVHRVGPKPKIEAERNSQVNITITFFFVKNLNKYINCLCPSNHFIFSPRPPTLSLHALHNANNKKTVTIQLPSSRTKWKKFVSRTKFIRLNVLGALSQEQFHSFQRTLSPPKDFYEIAHFTGFAFECTMADWLLVLPRRFE